MNSPRPYPPEFRHRALELVRSTREGKLYCCVVIDVSSRCVVGWAIDIAQRADRVTG